MSVRKGRGRGRGRARRGREVPRYGRMGKETAVLLLEEQVGVLVVVLAEKGRTRRDSR